MRNKPKPGQLVWWLDCLEGETVIVLGGKFSKDMDWKFNLFATRKEAEEARKKIVEILKG